MNEKVQTVELKEEDRKLLRSAIDTIKGAHKHDEKSSAPIESKHEHFAVELAYMEKGDACPDCVKGLDAFGKEYMKNSIEQRGKLDYECSECGLGVQEKEETCPLCGGKYAKKRD